MTERNTETEGSSPEPGADPERDGWAATGEPNARIVEAVAAATGRDREELSPLGRHVDPDALETILKRGASESGAAVHVAFDWDDVAVVAGSDGTVDVRPTGDSLALDGPGTAAELDATLQRLFRAAVENGVDVDGGWEVRNGDDIPDLDVHVASVERPD